LGIYLGSTDSTSGIGFVNSISYLFFCTRNKLIKYRQLYTTILFLLKELEGTNKEGL
jgi:hypothetical protein